MKAVCVPLKNLLKLTSTIGRVMERSAVESAIILLTAHTGLGKSTSVARALPQFGATFYRANSATTYSSLLNALCFELGLEQRWRNSDKLNAITDFLKDSPRPIFIDEADNLARDGRMLEVLRDIHDIAGVPVLIVGMDGFERKLTRYPQFMRRISQRIEFRPCDLDDARKLAKELCEVSVADDLVSLMHKKAKGSVGLMVVALAHFERLAKGNQLKSINAAQWGDRPMFVGASEGAA